MLKAVEKLLHSLPSNVCREVQLDVHAAIADDRARRIKELVREWVGREAVDPFDIPESINAAALVIDAIDDAEVPAKGERS